MKSKMLEKDLPATLGLDSRERILRAAIEEFAAKGQAGARIDEIVKASGVNVRMIYHHFGNKDGLYRAVIEQMIEDKTGVLGQISHPSEIEEIRLALEGIHTFLVEHRSYARILAWEFAALCPILDDVQKQGRDFSVFIAERVKVLQERTEIRSDVDPMWFGVTSVACIMAETFWAPTMAGLNVQTGARTADQLMKLILH
jgi:AcrR family transcriptional regulator